MIKKRRKIFKTNKPFSSGTNKEKLDKIREIISNGKTS